MKITAVRHFTIQSSFRNVFIVKVETDQGLYGLGEAGTAGREKALAGMIDHYARFLVGQDPRRIEHIWQRLYRGQYFEGGTIIAAAVSAIDIALWDIMGKWLKVPVYQLLGGKSRDHVQCFSDSGVLNGQECVQTAMQRVAAGWRHLRFAPGMADPKMDNITDGRYEPRESMALAVHWLGEVRRAVGPDIRLSIDFHHRLSVTEAAEFCRKVESLDLMFLEEPIRSESPQAYAALRRMTSMPFAIGEEFSSKWAFLPYVEEGLTNFARVDLCNVGGFTEAMKVAGMCEAHYIDMMPHNPLGPICTAATVHFCTAINNFALKEYNAHVANYPQDVFTGAPVLEGDHLLGSDEPGIGVLLNEQAAADHPAIEWEAPQYHRSDGSYTNW